RHYDHDHHLDDHHLRAEAPQAGGGAHAALGPSSSARLTAAAIPSLPIRAWNELISGRTAARPSRPRLPNACTRASACSPASEAQLAKTTLAVPDLDQRRKSSGSSSFG